MPSLSEGVVVLTDKDGHGPTGFPVDAVYEFDQAVWEQLDAAWRKRGVVRLKTLWQEAQPLPALLSD